jgi:hypothetical protein
MLYLQVLLLMAYVFPSHYDMEQQYNATVIINKAKQINEESRAAECRAQETMESFR